MPEPRTARCPRRLIAPLAALALVALFPLSGATFYVELTTKVMIMAIFALSLDLLVGWTGLVSFGHAAYFGVGAYALAMLSPKAAAAGLWSSLGDRGARGGRVRASSSASSCSAPAASTSSW